MRTLVAEAYGGEAHNPYRLPRLGHAHAVAQSLQQALGESLELAGDTLLREDLYLASLGHELFASGSAEEETVGLAFGVRVHALIEAMTCAASHESVTGAAQLIQLASLIDNITSCTASVGWLRDRWVRRTFMPLAAAVVENALTGELATLNHAGQILRQRLLAAYNLLVARMSTRESLRPDDPMEAANEVARSGREKGTYFDPEVGESVLRRMKEQEWREALLVRTSHLFPRPSGGDDS